MKKIYYGIFGINGCGLYTDYSKACDAMTYLYKAKIKRFNNFGEAQCYAIYGLMEYHPYKILPEKMPINFTVYAKACADIM